jgi:hypothetical protein
MLSEIQAMAICAERGIGIIRKKFYKRSRIQKVSNAVFD